MARRRHLLYPPDTPARALQDAVAAAYPNADLSVFFDDLAEWLDITAKSASGTYYAFLRGERSLPARHRDAYLDLTSVAPTVLNDLDQVRLLNSPPALELLREIHEMQSDLLAEVRKLASGAH